VNLSFTDYVGYYPKLCLQGLSYPRLKESSITGMTLSYTTYILWICNHGATFQVLLLVDCPIIIQVQNHTIPNAEHYPIVSETATEITSLLIDLR
jgi:hypothetical protein